MKTKHYYCRYSLYKPDPLECRIRKTLGNEACGSCERPSVAKENTKTLVQLLARDAPYRLNIRKHVRNSASTG